MDNFLIRKAQVDDLPIIQDMAIVANMLLTRFVIGFPKYCRLQSRGCLVKTYSLTSKKEERKVKKILSLVMALFAVSLLGKPVQAIGQEWSTEQKELWETNKTRWELWKKAEDPEAFKAKFHKDFVWWGWSNIMPLDKDRWTEFQLGKMIKSYEIKPIEARISGNVGILMFHYRVTTIFDTFVTGRIAATYIKEDGKWLFLGGMAASCTTKAPCPPF